MLKKPEILNGFQGRSFYRQNWGTGGGRGAGYVTLLWLVGGEVTGWCSRNLNHQPSGSNQSGVPGLMLSLKSPSSPWVEPLVPAEELRVDCSAHPPRRNQGLVHHCTIISFCIPSLLQLLTQMSFGTQGRSRKLKPFSYKQEKDTERPLYLGEPHRVLHAFSISALREWEV